MSRLCWIRWEDKCKANRVHTDPFSEILSSPLKFHHFADLNAMEPFETEQFPKVFLIWNQEHNTRFMLLNQCHGRAVPNCSGRRSMTRQFCSIGTFSSVGPSQGVSYWFPAYCIILYTWAQMYNTEGLELIEIFMTSSFRGSFILTDELICKSQI
jgi:hypothetical protein